MEDTLTLLRKGALIAQNHDFESIPELDEEDLEALRYEREHKWRQTKGLYMTIVLCSIGAAVQ